MSILIDRKTRVVVQGITGKAGSFHTERMLDYGTRVVAGVTPGKAGTTIHGVPVFGSMRIAVEKTGADASVVFVPATFAFDAICEAIDAGVGLIAVITEGIPEWDMMRIRKILRHKTTRLLGPNSPGITNPGECKLGIIPSDIHRTGSLAVLSRSGTLAYDAIWQISGAGLGQSCCIGIGGDAVLGMSFVDCLRLLADDTQTESILIIGEIGGEEEERAAEFIRENNIKKSIFAYVAGRFAPVQKRMGHAGAIMSQNIGSASAKIFTLKKCGAVIIDSPAEIGSTLKRHLC